MSDSLTPAAMLEKLNELIAEKPHAVEQFLLVQEGLRNPATVVRGRAGFLLCREYMARFVEQGGDATTAASIRANWIPAWGDDPGPPRRYDFNEIVECGDDEGGPPWVSKPIGPNLEAMCEAAMIMFSLGMTPTGEEPASVDRSAEGGETQSEAARLDPKDESAVGSEADETPNPSHPSQFITPEGEKR